MTDALELVSGLAKQTILSPDSDCLICDLSSRDRREIEEMMACHVSDATICSIIKQKSNVTVDKRVIAKHIDHLPAKYYTYRQIVERRAIESGISLDDDSTDKLTPLAYIESVLNDAMSTLIANPNSTNQMVGLRAAETLMAIEQDKASREDVSQWVLRFKQLLNAIQLVCSEDQIKKIVNMVGAQS